MHDSTWQRRDSAKEERLYNALGQTLNQFIKTEGASNAMIAHACGTFFAQVWGYFCATACADDAAMEQLLTTHLAEIKAESVQRAHYHLDHPETLR